MKKHIVRAMQTDRYGLDVPTKLSELEDDITSMRLALTSAIRITTAAPVTESFVIPTSTFTGAFGTTQTLGTVVSQNSGFSLPTAGNLEIPIPATGVYAINLAASWRSTVDTNMGVGVIWTNYTLSLSANASVPPGVVGAYAGAVFLNNKMGPARFGSDTGPSALTDSITTLFAAGDVITCTSSIVSESPAIGGSGLISIIDLIVQRIA